MIEWFLEIVLLSCLHLSSFEFKALDYNSYKILPFIAKLANDIQGDLFIMLNLNI